MLSMKIRPHLVTFHINATDVIAGLSSIGLSTEAIKLSIQALKCFLDKQMVLKRKINETEIRIKKLLLLHLCC